MKELINKTFSKERDLYHEQDLTLINCRFSGEEDGESALKEVDNVVLINNVMELRYPLWHGKEIELNNVTMTETCRAALWYSKDIDIYLCNLFGIKALRECKDITINITTINSPEFGWKCDHIKGNNLTITSEYAFFESKNITLSNIKFKGKYSFQYVENLKIENSNLDTKDAFWHAKNVTIKNSIIKGEYLGWYSEDVTLINCTIIGTQPLCYCKNLKLVDCKTENCDLAFEYSEVEGNIIGSIDSIKNPKSGTIRVDEIKEQIYTNDCVYEPLGKIVVKAK